MNVFATLMAGNPSSFEMALSRRHGPGGLVAVIRRLKEAEVAAAERCLLCEDPSERASKQRYVDAISCARVELERMNEEA